MDVKKLQPWLIQELRESLDLDADDTSRDEFLSQQTVEQLFTRYCTYNGLIGYASTLIDALDTLRKIDKEK
jgi:hypothetical protein